MASWFERILDEEGQWTWHLGDGWVPSNSCILFDAFLENMGRDQRSLDILRQFAASLRKVDDSVSWKVHWAIIILLHALLYTCICTRKAILLEQIPSLAAPEHSLDNAVSIRSRAFFSRRSKCALLDPTLIHVSSRKFNKELYRSEWSVSHT